MKHYGLGEVKVLESPRDLMLEEFLLKGYTCAPEVFSSESLVKIRKMIDEIYRLQESEFSKENLERISDLNTCRCPLKYDELFLEYACHENILALAKLLLGDFFILSLQNANLNQPNSEHHQISFHRDLPYQNFETSEPIAINALVAIDALTKENGGMVLLPHSHIFSDCPSENYIENNQQIIEVPKGSIVFFNSMLIHRAGVNKSKAVRRTLNHMITKPFIKQQYNFPAILGKEESRTEFEKMYFGYSSAMALDDVEWRMMRMAKYRGS